MKIHPRSNICGLFVLSTLTGLLICQDVPVDISHPVNDFILRYSAKGVAKSIHPGLKPFSINQINAALDEISNAELSKSERDLLFYFIREFDVNNFKKGFQAPWQISYLKKGANAAFSPYNQNSDELRFISYRDKGLSLWIDWEELISVDAQDTIHRSFNNDHVTVSGRFNENVSFYSSYSLFRVGYQDSDPIPEEFKQGYLLLEENTHWLIWDVSEASLKWNNSIVDIELSKIPVYWGFSRRHSPILSGNVQPFSFFRLSKNYYRVRAESIIGSLVPYCGSRKSNIEEKHIAAHRFEFDLTQSLTISFNEMVIYARRNLELGYLLPVNLFWSEEHSLGNRDNVLMSFDTFWNVTPGLSVYGTFFWDELSWFKLFSPWWGNKFIFQSGFHWVPFSNPKLPDFRIEYTASRPWVYTHQDSLLNYTSAGHGLGFPTGPNSQLLYLEMNMWPTYKTYLSFNISYLIKGSGVGSTPNDNYSLRDKSLDNNTPFLLGDVHDQFIVGTHFRIRVTELFYITGKLIYNNSENIFEGKLGLLMNY